jgi:DNA-directed RNA polymerase specialized sigma24 family protein
MIAFKDSFFETWSDESLWERFAQYDCHDAFAEIVRRFQSLLASHLASKFSFDASTIDDVLQLTWIEVVSIRQRNAVRQTIKPWLCAIAFYVGLKFHAKIESFHYLPEDNLVDSTQSLPIDVLVKRENCQHLVEILQDLPSAQFQLLRTFLTRGINQTAAENSLSVRHARRKIDDIVIRLKRQMA